MICFSVTSYNHISNGLQIFFIVTLGHVHIPSFVSTYMVRNCLGCRLCQGPRTMHDHRSQMTQIHTPATEDPHLGLGVLDDSSEVSISQDESDSGSLLSDDSIFPDYERARRWSCPGTTLYEACARNEALTVRRVLERGVTQEEVMELDINGRVGERVHLQCWDSR